jgi:hypothetical protein
MFDSALHPGTAVTVGSYEDRELIKDLYARYAQATDDDQPEAFAECFAPDGAITASGVPNGHVQGRDSLQRMTRHAVAWNAGNGITAHRHLNMNLRISIDGDRAQGSCNLLYCWVRDGKNELVLTGGYNDKLVKIDGRWYFESRDGYSDTEPSRTWD